MKETHNAAFQAAVGSTWDIAKNSSLNVLTGTMVATGRQVMLLVPDRMAKTIINMLAKLAPLTLIKAKNARPMDPVQNCDSYDPFVLTEAPTPARFKPENLILGTVFNGHPLSLSQVS